MQINIQLTKQKDQTLVKKIKDFHSKRYSYLSLPKLFLHAMNELMNKESLENVHHWDCTIDYYKPTKVIFEGKLCVTVGINNTPIEIPL